MTNAEKEGIKAIKALQAMAGVKETDESALKGWKALSEQEQRTTMAVYEIFFPPKPEGAKQ